jgi:FKBP-type peptidyl-prolyl cis-trans isomerase SlyD
MAIENNQKVTMHYRLRMEGEHLDANLDNGTFEFVFGAGQIIPGLEARIADMNVGDSREVVVPAREAYGEYDINAKKVYLKEHFSEDDLELGAVLEATGHDGQPVFATISDIMEKEVVLDLNHPMAGKDLNFSIMIEAIE